MKVSVSRIYVYILDRMAQLLVHIDADLKRKLKTKLAAEGKTFKTWAEEMAHLYLREREPDRRVVKKHPPSEERDTVHPQTGYVRSDYNVEED